ncbi:hypothetical protein YC2023_055043 [Brassica napus]
MSLIRLLLVLIACLICFVGSILSRGDSLRRRRSSLRWLSPDQKVKLLFHVFESMIWRGSNTLCIHGEGSSIKGLQSQNKSCIELNRVSVCDELNLGN